jgi:hypothetical protein
MNTSKSKQLYHAIMALSALSMAYKNHVQSADALEHYQKVIPALKSMVQSTEDSYSDGALLSHYLLLLYEVSTILWPSHQILHSAVLFSALFLGFI